MHPARIAELLQPFLSNSCHSSPGLRLGEACPEGSRREPAVLSPAQLDHISTYIDILLRWNARINLTAIRDPEEIVTRHFGESLFAARHLFPEENHREDNNREGHDFRRADANSNEEGRALAPKGSKATATRIRVADLGSGAGFPGIPIKLWAPDITMTLIESNHRKAAFLREVARALTLTDINIQNTRAENVHETFNLVTLRAVERFTSVLPIATRLLAPDGRLALLIASPQVDSALSTLPLINWQDPVSIPESTSRVLLVGASEPTK
jgi:16S rRNA (guanine527-N7)-methyltransferase